MSRVRPPDWSILHIFIWKKYMFNSQKMRNASRFCVSSLRRGHANLLCIVPILLYVLPKQVQQLSAEIFVISKIWSNTYSIHFKVVGFYMQSTVKLGSNVAQFQTVSKWLRIMSKICTPEGCKARFSSKWIYYRLLHSVEHSLALTSLRSAVGSASVS